MAAFSHFEIPIHNLLHESQITKQVSVDLHKILPQDVLNSAVNTDNETQNYNKYGSIFKINSNLVENKFQNADPHDIDALDSTSFIHQQQKSKNVFIWRTLHHNTLSIFNLNQKSNLKIILNNLDHPHYILPKVSIIYSQGNIEAPSFLSFMTSNGILFKLPLINTNSFNPMLNHNFTGRHNILENIHPEIFEFKKSVFAINSHLNIDSNLNEDLVQKSSQKSGNSHASTHPNHVSNFIFTDFTYMSEHQILLKNNVKIFQFHLNRKKKPIKSNVIYLNNTTSNYNKRRKMNSPEVQKNINNKSFFSSFFTHQNDDKNSSACSSDIYGPNLNKIVHFVYDEVEQYLYFMQADGLFRKFKYLNSDNSFREVEAKYLIREIEKIRNDIDSANVNYDFTFSKIYLDSGKLICIFEDVENNLSLDDTFDEGKIYEICLFSLRELFGVWRMILYFTCMSENCGFFFPLASKIYDFKINMSINDLKLRFFKIFGFLWKPHRK